MSKQLLMHGRVTKIRQASPSLRIITVEPTWRQSFPGYAGGAHVNVRIPDGRMRQYSLCGNPRDAGYTIAVRRECDGRGVSLYLHTGLSVNDELHVSYPQEQFVLNDAATSHRFIAGGVGITPIVGMVFDLVQQGREQHAMLHYLVRSEADAVFATELRELGLNVQILPNVRSSRPAVLSELTKNPRTDECLYVCGPPQMLDDCLVAASKWAWTDVRYEVFVKPPAVGEVLGEPFSAYLTSSNKEVHVGEKDTLLEALIGAGAPVQSSCEGGVCGTCIVDFGGGQAIHNDLCLTDDERKELIVTCVSRGKGQLRLSI